MRAVRQAGAQAVALAADVGRASSKSLAKQGLQVRLGHDGATSTRVVIASSAFIVLLGAALLFGGHAAIGPLLHPSPDVRDARGAGDIVVAMPDGKFCRHMSFDNTTASMVEGTIVPCTTDITRDSRSAAAAAPRGFAWGIH